LRVATSSLNWATSGNPVEAKDFAGSNLKPFKGGGVGERPVDEEYLYRVEPKVGAKALPRYAFLENL